MLARIAGLLLGLVLSVPALAQCDRIQLFGNNVKPGSKFGQWVAIEGDLVAVGKASLAGPVRLFDAATGVQRGYLAVPPGEGVGKFGASIDMQGGLAAVGAAGQAGALHIFSMPDGVHRRVFKVPGMEHGVGFGSSIALWGDRVVGGAQYLTSGGHVAAGAAFLFDLGEPGGFIELAPSVPMEYALFGSAVAMDAKHIAVGAPGAGSHVTDGAVHVFDAVTGAELYRLASPTPGLFGFGHSLDIEGGRLLVGHGNGQRSFLYDLASGTEQRVLVHHSSGIGDVALTQDHALLASGFRVWVFDVETSVLVGAVPTDLGPGNGSVGAIAAHGGRLVMGAPWWESSTSGGAAFRVDLCELTGTLYCSPAKRNSLNWKAQLLAHGWEVAARDEFHLSVHGVPAYSPGTFLASLTRDFISGAGMSKGNLCLGGQILRPIGGVKVASSYGSFEVQVRLSQLPVLAGETWHFQAWYRDAVGQPFKWSNYSDARSIRFH